VPAVESFSERRRVRPCPGAFFDFSWRYHSGWQVLLASKTRQLAASGCYPTETGNVRSPRGSFVRQLDYSAESRELARLLECAYVSSGLTVPVAPRPMTCV